MFNLQFYPFELKFRHPFALAAGRREHTSVVFVELKFQNHTGFGEAALPDYLPETQESVMSFLSHVQLKQFDDVMDADKILDYILSFSPKNYPAMAALDMALHDLKGKILNTPCYRIWNLDKNDCPETTYTIGMDSPEMILKKLDEAKDFNLLKVKLGGANDKEIINTIRSVTDKAICVDANQGWKEKEYALEMIHWLGERGTVFVEQPLDKNKPQDAQWLKAKSPLPVIADEAVQTVADIERIKDAYHGINIKLMKCGGLREAMKMIRRAGELNLKVMFGCMSESSCGVSAAAQFAPLADWTDLDGPLLITNDPFGGITYSNGKIILNDLPGIGVEKVK
ncbi:MAG TPA: dipeptide epimerase [Bacteroidia bacterium]|nr:dipeptide epimerase [Bacteroidia bacterium]